MQTLSISAKPALASDLPIRAIQFGEGNFLRGFLDWMLFKLNSQKLFNGRVVAVQPTTRGRTVPLLKAQDGLYTVIPLSPQFPVPLKARKRSWSSTASLAGNDEGALPSCRSCFS